MGSMLGIGAFTNKTQYADMTNELNRAQAKDRKAERESAAAGDRLRSLLGGQEINIAETNSAFVPKLRKWVPWMREAFGPYIIRRTLDSIDYSGERIFGLPPYEEHTMLLKLRDWELQRLHNITSELIDNGSLATLAGAGKASYIA